MAAFPLITDSGPAIAEAIWGAAVIVGLTLGLVAAVIVAVGRFLATRLEEVASAVGNVDVTLSGIREDLRDEQLALQTEEAA